MRKEWGTGEKEFGNLLGKERKQGSKHIVSRFETKRNAYELCFCRCRIGCPPPCVLTYKREAYALVETLGLWVASVY